MNALFDIFAFLSVVLHGVDLVAQSVLLGSVLFFILIAVPVCADDKHDAFLLRAGTRRAIKTASLVSLATIVVATALNASVLANSLGIAWGEVAGADFVVAGVIKALAAAAIYVVVSQTRADSRAMCVALGVFSMIIVYGALDGSHAAARLTGSGPMMLATGMHEVGAALWLGGLPCFRVALLCVKEPATLARIGRRVSALSITGVALIVAGAVGIATGYLGSIDAVYGTAYGAMAVTKSVLLAMLLALGLGNFRAVRQFATNPAAVDRVRRFVEIEMGIGVAVLMAAASITSMPPAIDLVENRVTLSDIRERMAPKMPRLASPDHVTLALPALQAKLEEQRHQSQGSSRGEAFVPSAANNPPRNAQDIAWSEYNHHWAGLLVVLVGLAALAEKSGRAAWAKHWPLLFLLLAAFLFLRADPEVWPMGELGFFASLSDPEVAQHRIFVVLIIVFAIFEWGVRTGRIVSRRLARVFPLLTAIGATLLLTHSHALGNVKEELLIEMTHLPIAVLGIAAGWAHWYEVEAPEGEGHWAGWLWPVCFVLIGLLLLGYREA